MVLVEAPNCPFAQVFLKMADPLWGGIEGKPKAYQPCRIPRKRHAAPNQGEQQSNVKEDTYPCIQNQPPVITANGKRVVCIVKAQSPSPFIWVVGLEEHVCHSMPNLSRFLATHVETKSHLQNREKQQNQTILRKTPTNPLCRKPS